MTKSVKNSPVIRERAARTVCEDRGQYESQWAAAASIAARSAAPQNLPDGVRQHERDTTQREA
ncbi:MAG TPA: hypothetical protein VLJ86_12560 [Ramlibacter sp.]|nr:hypothetical protein [Ramlibacter sp.]